jgi:crotonobetainyl-CoA:carnitine CoA-transferase CaiB-like acyl-CoA transferase
MTSAGAVPALLPPGCTEARMDAVPALGQHSRAVLAGLGFDDATIDHWARDGAI